MKRLSLTIFVAVLASLLLFALAVVGIWTWTWQARAERMERQIATIVADPVLQAEDSDQATLERALRRLNIDAGFDLAIVDARNRPIAQAGRPIPPGRRYFERPPGPPPDGADDARPPRGDGGGERDEDPRRSRRWVASFDLPGDRWLLVRPVRGEPPPPPVGLMSGTALLMLAVALVAWPVSRRITRRLERLQRGVEQLGAGDLGARVPVEGRDEVAALARSVNASAARIEDLVNTQGRLLDSQRRLLANASHELRSPLARIRLALELLLPEHPTRDDAGVGGGGVGAGAVFGIGSGSGSSAQTNAGGIAATMGPAVGLHERALRDEALLSVSELDRLIDEILIASRIDAAQVGRGDVLGREPVDLIGLAAEEAARVDAEVEMAADGEGEVIGDPRLLRRLLRNLLENAARYHRQAKGAVAAATTGPAVDELAVNEPAVNELAIDELADDEPVLVRIDPSAAGAVEVVVLDRGPGVAAAEREKIFEAFYRVEGHSEGAGGVGLGLSLARQIARAQGGDLRCEARPGGGSAFIATLARIPAGPDSAPLT